MKIPEKIDTNSCVCGLEAKFLGSATQKTQKTHYYPEKTKKPKSIFL